MNPGNKKFYENVGLIQHFKKPLTPIPHVLSLEAAAGGHIDDEPLVPGHHHPGGERGADVVTSQPHPVDAVPGADGLRLPELLAHAREDGVDPGVGVVHKHVQLPVLLLLDPLEELLDVRVHAVVHGDGDGVAAALLDLAGAVLEVGGGAARDVDRGPGLAQLQRDATADTTGGSRHQTHLALQGRRHCQHSEISLVESIVEMNRRTQL